MAKRFASHTESDILEKRANVVPKNTSKGNQKSARILRDYLKEKSQDPEFENYDAYRLNEVLSHLYLDMRKADGEMYKTSSLENFRYGLNRYLKAPPFLKTFDIIKDHEFYPANESFKTALAELKNAGKGGVDHYPAIEDCDLKKLYSSIHLCPETPSGLLNKVQLDIRLYFCRRGVENMTEMTKDTFSIEVDPNSGLRYVKKAKDELIKNRRAKEKEMFGGYMTENRDSPLCPVRSFEKYIEKLHPENGRLWQRPRESYTENDAVWYTKQPLGKDSLSSFMSKLSKSCGLSKIYTNHSLRATGTSILFKRNFADSQIMVITGHKSVNSLAVYHRVSDQEKFEMSKAIQTTVDVQNMRQLPAPTPIPMLTNSASSTSSDVILRNSATSGEISELNGFDIEQLFAVDTFCDELGDHANAPSTSRNNVKNPPRKPPGPVFSNCTIGFKVK
jgi:hypothetical protein